MPNLGGWKLRYMGREGDPTETIYGVELIPVNDLREHELDCECWCNPKRDEESDEHLADGFWIHNAMDGREAHEEGLTKPS